MAISRHRYLVAAVLSILLGFMLLGLARSETIAPLMLVAGYCLFLPLWLWGLYRRGVGE